MVGLKTVWITIFGLFLLGACVPQTKQTECASNEAFNSTLRSCVSVASTETNNRPVPIDQNETTTEDTALNFYAEQATDTDGDELSYIVISGPAHGTLTNCMNKAGSSDLTDLSCSYTPETNFAGTDSFTYKVNDGIQDSSSYGKVTLTVTAVDDAPTVTTQLLSFIMVEDTAKTYTFIYSDPEGELASSCSITGTTNLTVTTACSCDAFGVCTATFTPNSNLNSLGSSFSFNYSLTAGTARTGTESVTVSASNDKPVLTTCAASFARNQNVALSCTPTAADADGTTSFTWSLVSGSGTCSWLSIDSSTGDITGTPRDDDILAGDCSIKVRAYDTIAYSDTLTIPVTLTNVAPGITAVDTTQVLNEDPSTNADKKIGFIGSSLPSSSTCDGDEIFCVSNEYLDDVTISAQNTGVTDCDDYGTITFSTSSSNIVDVLFTPDANWNGTCDLNVLVQDQNGGSDSSTTTVTVTAVNDNPTFSVSSLSNQTTNEATTFVVDANTSTVSIDPMVIDEGGGSDEDAQTLTVTVQSSNTTLIPHATNNIQMYADSSFATAYSAGLAAVGGVTYTAPDGNSDDLYLVIKPAVGQAGSATITITLTDSGVESASRSFTLTVTDDSAVHNDWSEIYTVGAKKLSDGTIESEPQVSLSWNAFTAYSGASIIGYRVYRSESATGPFLTPVSSTLISTSSRTFTDTTLTHASDDTTAYKTYYYKVMAVNSDGTTLDTSSTYSTIDVVIPHDNMALIHRRIANYETCTAMGKTLDKTNHNRCSYTGPGNITGEYYDIQNHYLVDRYEASCNYTINSDVCTETAGAGCIGAGTPSDLSITATNDSAIYYDRTNGQCYFYTSGAWKLISALISAELTTFAALNQQTTGGDSQKATFPKKPPLVNIQQYQAHAYCGKTTIGTVPTAKTLTSRLVHVTGAAWTTQTGASTLETGASLSLSVSQCNSSNGGSLTFQDALLSALEDTWTATESSATTRSFVMAGSDVTASCQSRYGIQDLVGNVEEWNLDRVFKNGNVDFLPLTGHTNHRLNSANYYPYTYIDSGSANVELTANADFEASYNWSSDKEDLDRIFLPLGIPTKDANGTLLNALVFNSDKFYIDQAVLDATGTANTNIDNTELVGFASGGSFQDESGAGRYTLRFKTVGHEIDFDHNYNETFGAIAEIIPANSGVETAIATGFRCMWKVPINPSP